MLSKRGIQSLELSKHVQRTTVMIFHHFGLPAQTTHAESAKLVTAVDVMMSTRE